MKKCGELMEPITIFSVADRALKTGTVYSPEKKSKMDRLIKIGYSLISLTESTENGKTVQLKTELINKIKKLTDELK